MSHTTSDSHFAKAYVLAQLQIYNTSPINWDTQAFDYLVVDETSKLLIQALVTNKIAAEKGTDVMSGKGNGLIVLLHG